MRTFFQRRHIDGQQAYEKMLIITNYHRNASKNHYETSSHTRENDSYQKDKK